MSKVIATFSREGFKATALELEDLSITFTADADIDADGANGQNGQRVAYKVGNTGSELLGNGGMTMRGGRVVGAESWFKDIVILGGDGEPMEFPGGIIASKTAYKFPDHRPNDPAAYVDSETVNYIAIPQEIRNGAKGVILGCKVKCYHRPTGKTAWGIVADIGPRTKVGEVSIAMARALGMNPSPRSGGEEKAVVEYTIYGNQFAEVNGKKVPLITAKGKYIYPEEDLGTLEKIS
jgi:hypothetical protein